MTWGLDELNSKDTHLPFVFALFKLEFIYKCGALGFRGKKQNCNKDFVVTNKTLNYSQNFQVCKTYFMS